MRIVVAPCATIGQAGGTGAGAVDGPQADEDSVFGRRRSRRTTTVANRLMSTLVSTGDPDEATEHGQAEVAVRVSNLAVARRVHRGDHGHRGDHVRAQRAALIEVSIRGRDSNAGDEIVVSQSPWHRRVSPIFFLLLVAAGLMMGFAGFVLLSAVAHTLGR